MTHPPKHTEFAAALEQATANAKPISPLRDDVGVDNLDAAYAIQRLQTDARIKDGHRLVGRKIGLTAKSVQKQLGVDSPDFGALFASMAYGEGEVIPASRFIAPKIEGEVALIMGRDLAEPQMTFADLIRSVEYVLPSLEIVDSRIANWDIGLVDTVADNASAGAFVLGGTARKLDGIDLARVEMSMRINGETASSGTGADCLGHPLNAALWLAKTLAEQGDPIREGDVVLTGALGPMAPVGAGDTVEAEISGLGQVSVQFGDADDD